MFTPVRPWGRWVRSESFGVLGFSLENSSGVVGLPRVRSRGRWVNPWSLGSLGGSLVVVGFIRGHLIDEDAPRGSFSSSGVVVFTRVRPGGR